MTFKEELDKILRDLHGYEVPLTGEVTLDADLDYENKLVTREIETALTSIINLVDKEVIGEDYPYMTETPDSTTWDTIPAAKNTLKAEQRAIIRSDNKNKGSE